LFDREIERLESLPAIVLAAGASSRMGRAKPLLPVGGRLCLEHVIDAFREAGSAPIVVVLGSGAEELSRRVALGGHEAPDLIPVVNEDWERGQTSSVKAGLRALPAGFRAVFVMPADHPLVAAVDIRMLARRFDAGEAGRSIFIPTWEGRRGHPLLVGAEHAEAILGLGDDEPLHAHLRAHADTIEHLPASGPGVVMGMNTEGEYRAVIEALGSLAEGHSGD
jgi:CTP:molybdopterin cytidylyltransferase MocA